MGSDFNSFEFLSEWLREDLDDIADEGAIFDTRLFLESLAASPDILGWRNSLTAALERIDGQQDVAGRLRILNQVLRDTFVSEMLVPHEYRRRLKSLETGEELANRRKARNALPTMDVLVQFDRDPRAPSQCARAAVLACAAIRLHCSDEKGGGHAPVLGSTLAPGAVFDTLAVASDDARVLVLVDGVVYTINLGRKPEDIGPAALQRTLEWILSDSRNHPPFRTLPLVTAARRTTCHEIRRILEADPRNIEAFEAVEGCLCAVCLDGSSSPEDQETLCRALFGNCANRWYGMTCLVIDASAEAGLIGSYGRGVDGVPGLVFCEKLHSHSLEIPLPDIVEPAKTLAARLVEFHCPDLGETAARAEAEVAGAFHKEPCFLDVNIGSSFFTKHHLPANPALNFLILLAAHETYGLKTPPAVSHAMSGRAAAEKKGGVDWVVISTKGILKCIESTTDEEWLERLLCAIARHADRAKDSRRGYSPSYFVRSPEAIDDRSLCEFFQMIGTKYATGYRSYLFRPTRWPGTMDILTSTLTLPDGIRYIGRAGAISDVATLFGMHIVVEAARTRMFMLPGKLSEGRLAEFHRALERMISRLRSAIKRFEPKVTYA